MSDGKSLIKLHSSCSVDSNEILLKNIFLFLRTSESDFVNKPILLINDKMYLLVDAYLLLMRHIQIM